MTPSSFHRLISPALAAVALFSVTSASAELRSYRATWSGTAHGNTAGAVARLVLDDDYLLNPGNNDNPFESPVSAIISFDITVFGASSGNGTWTMADFSGYQLHLTDAVNLFSNWVGQEQSSDGNTWGDPSSSTHDFNLTAAAASAPSGVGFYDLGADGGTAETLRLTSFGPASAPGALVYLGDTVDIDLSHIVHEPPGIAAGQFVKVTGLPAGLSFLNHPTRRILGTALGLPGSKGVQIQIRQGSRLIRSIPYNLAVEPFKFAGGFELLLEGADAEFINSDGITINNAAPAAPYPSTMTVSGVRGTITAVRVKLDGFTHTFPGDVDVFLMAPDGRVATVMSDAGSTFDVLDVDLVFADDAATVIPQLDQITSGIYRPANYGTIENVPPGGVGTIGSSLTELADNGANGVWKLFVRDDLGGDVGSLASWTLEFDSTPVPVGKLKVTVSSPTPRFQNPAFSATLERRGERRRVSRGFFFASDSPQTVTVTFPASRAYPAATYDVVIADDSDLVSATQTLPASNVTGRGFRLVRTGSIPGGNPKLTLSLPPDQPGDRATTPGGIGYATGSVNSKALVRVRGLLGDAQFFTSSLCLSHTNQAVVWITPYSNKLSYLGGIIGFGEMDLPGRGGSGEAAIPGLLWRRFADPKAKSYPAGFTPLELQALTSRWVSVTRAEALAQSLGLEFRGIAAAYVAPTTDVLPSQLSLRDNFTLLPLFPADAVPFTSRASGRLGSFAGKMRLPAPAVNSPVSGVFLQDEVFDDLIGQGLIKISITGPGLARGSFETTGIELGN